MTATSKGAMIYGTLITAMLAGVLTISIWTSMLVAGNSAAARRPAKIAIQRGDMRLEAETGHGEERQAFAADVVQTYRILKEHTQ